MLCLFLFLLPFGRRSSILVLVHPLNTGQKIQRETFEEGGILVRVAKSHIRVGTFQLAQISNKNENTKEPFDGKVIIIGAGAGGLSAGYLLQQQGIDFEILEASASYGGRMRINTDFADFPTYNNNT